MDLSLMYERTDTDALLAGGGGYSAIHLLPLLDFKKAQRSGKMLVGYSDISILQNALYKKTGIPQLSAPMPASGMDECDEYSWACFTALLSQKTWTAPSLEFGEFVKGSEMAGRIVGGNLRSVMHLLGTPYEPEWEGAIFMWEEVGEGTHRIDRALHQLALAGILDKIAGMVVGQVTVSEEASFFDGKRLDTKKRIFEILTPYHFPVLYTESFGHAGSRRLSFPIGGTISANREHIVFSY